MMDTGGRNVLAFDVRERGRAKLAPVSPAVISARRYPVTVSSARTLDTTPIKDVETDSFFCQPTPPEGCLLRVIFGAVALALAAGLAALITSVGG